MKHIPGLQPGLIAVLMAISGCAQSPCMQPDVLAFVDKARRAQDLYAIGLESKPVSTGRPILARDASGNQSLLCSASMLSRNPDFLPGNGQSRYIRAPQNFRVTKLAQGYEVSLDRP